MFLDYFRGIWRDRYILWSLVNTDLQLKYRRSKLGVAWAVLLPLGMALLVGSVFSIIFGSDPRTFIPLFFAGLNPWLFINGSADGGTMAFVGAEGYLKQTTVNAQIFPLRITIVNFINLLYSIIAFFAVYLLLQPDLFSAKMLMTLPGLLVLFFFTAGLANFAASINLSIRDYQPLQSLIFQGLFYITPIVFEAKMLSDRGFSLLYELNPFYYLIEIVRTPMQGRTLPSLHLYLVAIMITFILFTGSIYVVMHKKSKIVFKL